MKIKAVPMFIKSIPPSWNDALMLIGGLIVVALLLVPYASNGFWFDDAFNSQIYWYLHRIHGGLGEFSFYILKHWLEHEGRLMLGFFYGYPGFYFFNDLTALRIAQCVTVVMNIALYGYVLRLLGASMRFLVVWAVFLVGLFQIHGNGLDPVAGFAFHYQMLGIQLAIVLILFVKWVLDENPKFLYMALGIWLFFMLCYETNFIFIPIAFVIMFLNGDSYKRLPGILLVSVACLYLALTFYLKSHADGGAYAGSAFGLPSKMALAYLKQLTASFPFISYVAVTHTSLPFGALVKETASSTLAWAVFIFSLMILTTYTSIKSPTQTLKREAFIISLGMFLLPAVFPAISLRYQNEVGWGIGTLPVYYQDFGFAFFAAWTMSFIPHDKATRFIIPVFISLYLALNVTMNANIVGILDKFWREPRDALAVQARTGLFSQVNDGDVIHLKNVAHYITSNIVFEWSNKRVYIPTEDHNFRPETPGKFAKNFELSRSSEGAHTYQLVEIPAISKPN